MCVTAEYIPELDVTLKLVQKHVEIYKAEFNHVLCVDCEKLTTGYLTFLFPSKLGEEHTKITMLWRIYRHLLYSKNPYNSLMLASPKYFRGFCSADCYFNYLKENLAEITLQLCITL